MATVLLAQVFIEQSLGGTYAFAGDDAVAESGFSRLISESLCNGHITEELATTLTKLRKMRNPYAHHVSGTGKRSYIRRIVEAEWITPEDLVVEDAKFAVRAVVDYLRHCSPDWNPGNYEWNEEEEEI